MNSNKVAIITGASRGIGAATAKLFAANGFAVCINYVSNDEAAKEVADEIEQTGGRCIIHKADISNETEVLELFAAVDRKLGFLSVLVNNAAILKTQSRLHEMSADRINEVLKVNVTGSFLCA